MMHLLLSILVLLPLLGVALALAHPVLGHRKDELLRSSILAIMGAEVALAARLFSIFDPSSANADRLVERVSPWLGIDGLSLAMVLLITTVAFVGVLASRSIRKQVATYWAMYTLSVTGMLGVLTALDLRLFYVFWLMATAPLCFLVGVFGGEKRKRAVIELTIGQIVAAACLLFAFIALAFHAEPSQNIFSIPELAHVDFVTPGHLLLGMSFVKVVFVALFIAFAIAMGLFPFHLSLVNGLTEAPAGLASLLSAGLVAMGGYGLLRIGFGVLPEASAWAAPALAVLGVITLLAHAACALMQRDLKRLVVYASLSQTGYCLLGMASLTPSGIQASVLQLFSHGVVATMLFAVVGILQERVESREIARFGGLASEMPLFSALAGLGFLASLGAPGMASFIGNAMTLSGAFPVHAELTLVAAAGTIITAAYHLRAFQRVFFGELRSEWRSSRYLEPYGGKFPDLRKGELAILAPLAALSLVLGFWPWPLLRLIDGTAIDLVNELRPLGPMQIALLDSAERVIALLH